MLSKAQIKLITSLSVKKYRDEHLLFLAEGDKLIADLLQSTLNIKYLYTTPASNIKHPKAECITEEEMKRISALKTPSASLAVIAAPQHTLNINSLKDELVLALDDVQDPGNLGTIIRIANWFGIKHIICSPHTADCYSPKTIQATMGAITRVNIYYTNLAKALSTAQLNNIPIYGTFLEGNIIYSETLPSAGIMVMGSEGQGISAEIEALVTHKLFIPPYNNTSSESLNVAVATAIVCSEFRRR